MNPAPSAMLTAVLVVLAASAAAAQPLAVPRFTIGGGGGVSTGTTPAGRVLAVSGIPGQSSAGPGSGGMSGVAPDGRTFGLVGGFWSGRASRPPCAPDFSGDGELNADDLSDFVTCFLDPVPCPGADFDASGVIDGDDLSAFVTAYFDGCR